MPRRSQLLFALPVNLAWRMAEWTRPAQLRTQLMQRWERGELLAGLVSSDQIFPLRLALRGPSSGELSDHFDEVRAWAAELQQGAASGYRLVLREVKHRIIGQNSVPDQAWVDTLGDALHLISKTREARVFQKLLDQTHAREPLLLPWLQRRPLRALELADDWQHLLDFVAWLQAHLRPGVYLRQVDLPGVHSKFIEGHRAVLTEWLDLALPAQAIDTSASVVSQFARRYGFLDKPLRLRIRFLDPNHAGWAPGADQDYSLRHDAFAALAPPVSRVLITENEINFLATPPLANTLLVFGAGYGFDAMAQARWLDRCTLHYWGDIDTHGFAILDQLRAHFPHARSLLMDVATLNAHATLWTDEPQPTQRDLPRLTAEERGLYDNLRWRRLDGRAVRLEQERIGFGWVTQALQALNA